jgi:hypothetical protein
MFVEFFTSNSIRIQVLEVSVLLGKTAFIQCYCFLPSGLTLYKLDMDTEEYSKWGADDDYIKHWICSKVPLLGHPVDNVEELPNQPVLQSNLDANDNRSFHNEMDIQKINDLETQLNEQKLKLDKILGLLGKNNLI